MADALESHDFAVVFLRHDAEVLLERQRDIPEFLAGTWSGLTRGIDDTPVKTAKRLAARVGEDTNITLIRDGNPLSVTPNKNREITLYPFLFDSDTRHTPSTEQAPEQEWVSPTEILRRNAAIGVWEAYTRVKPTPTTIENDSTHGSAYISIRAMEVLRDEAGAAAYGEKEKVDPWEDLVQVAEDLLAARPSMTALTNRVNRIMNRAVSEASAESVVETAIEEITSALNADQTAAEEATNILDGRTVLTLSRSGTLYPALVNGPDQVLIAESRPQREGVDVAEELEEDGVDVSLFTDAAIAHTLRTNSVDAVVVGADTILRDSSVVNKTGTLGAAIAAANFDIPVYVVTAVDKISPEDSVDLETGSSDQVYEGDRAIEVENPTFDETPAEYVSGVVTEQGLLTVDEVIDIGNEHAQLSDWPH